jgi:hypothetical protein
MAKLNLKSARSVALDLGLPYKAILNAIAAHQVRTVTVGRRPLIPDGAIDDFLRSRTSGPSVVRDPEQLSKELVAS